MSCGRHCTRVLITLSPYQRLCCIVSLIVSFCSIKSPIFAVYIHISPCFFCASVVVWFSGGTVRSTNELTTRNRMATPPKKHGDIWIKAANIGDLFYGAEQSNQRHNTTKVLVRR